MLWNNVGISMLLEVKQFALPRLIRDSSQLEIVHLWCVCARVCLCVFVCWLCMHALTCTCVWGQRSNYMNETVSLQVQFRG